MQSLLRLGTLGVANGWEVILFDPQGSQAAAFAEAVQQARNASCQFLQETGNSIPIAFDDAHARYFGFQIWSHPNEARLFAQGLLAAITRKISERCSERRTLLLFNHPELLFENDEISPLFALMDRLNGSVFLSARSPRDFDHFYAPILLNAQTLIVHRSIPSYDFDFTARLSLDSWERKEFEQILRRLPDNECMVLSAGEAAHVRLGLPDFPSPAMALTIAPPPDEPDLGSTVDEEDALLSSLFQPDAENGYACSSPASHRSLVVGNNDQAHVDQATDLLWGQTFPYRLTRRLWRLRGPHAE